MIQVLYFPRISDDGRELAKVAEKVMQDLEASGAEIISFQPMRRPRNEYGMTCEAFITYRSDDQLSVWVDTEDDVFQCGSCGRIDFATRDRCLFCRTPMAPRTKRECK